MLCNRSKELAVSRFSVAKKRSNRHAQDDGAQPHGLGVSGTPPSNTVPSNSNYSDFKALRFGRDSLYLSYPGGLAEDWSDRLLELKELAQSTKETDQALAQVTIASHIFEVRDRGFGRFAYVLVDNCFVIKLSSTRSRSLPLAHVQISSAYLAAVGPVAAEQDLRVIINTLGRVTESANVSRADLFLDLVCTKDLNAIEQPQWVTRANLMAKYFDCRLDNPFTGWVVGIGGDIHSRLYDKLTEIRTQSHKVELFELWQAAGWDGTQTVWRMEFQVHREVLKQLGLVKLASLLAQETSLWRFFTGEWLRLAVPIASDQTRSRWPNHRLWDCIAAAYSNSNDQPRLKRFRPQRLPDDERLFVQGLGGLTSFMAREGIEDFRAGVSAFANQASSYHKSTGRGIARYVREKVKAKGRKYNSIDNRKNLYATREAHEQQEAAYRKLKDG